MKQFRLLQKGSDGVLTKFHVIDCADGSIVGSINVASESASDLAQHWLGSATQPQASSSPRKKDALAAAFAANRRPGSIAPTASKPNPMVATMVRASKKNTLSAAAILRGC